MLRNFLHPLTVLPNTELVITLPTPVWRVRARSGNGIPMRLSFNAGEVAGGGGVNLTSEYWDTGWMPKPPGPIYVASSFAGSRGRIEIWTENQVVDILDVAAFDFGYDLGYFS